MMLRLDPTVPIVWRDPYCLQVGIDDPVCTLPEATTATQRMLAALAVGVPRSALTVIGTNAGASEAQVAALLNAVRPALLTGKANGVRPVVALDDENALLPQLRALAEQSGIRVVTASDAHGATVAGAVIVANFAVTPAQHGAWLSRDVPHLPVVFGDRLVRIGPFVEPGVGPCVHCVQLERVDEDPAWPAMATQLVAKSAASSAPLSRTDATVRVVRMLADRLIARSRSYLATSIVIDAATGSVTERSHRPHERCACRALPENVTVLDGQRAPSPAQTSSVATGGARA
jgi:bacteriocin biosynthesis cyclodehydratase domain-containing protein